MVEKKDFGDNLIADFLALFDKHSINNPVYSLMILHCLLGQALRNVYFSVGARKIDTRLHLLLIRPSGAGKGAGYGFFCQLAADLGLQNEKLSESTSAGLSGTGTINQKGEVEINDGLMKYADFISMEEAATLFDYDTTFSKQNLTYLQIAMNPLDDASCEIIKRIGSIPEAIRFKPHCSFLLLTYVPDKFIDALIKRGVIQRFVTVMQDVTLEERIDILDKAINRLNSEKVSSFEEEYQSLLLRLKIIIRKFQAMSKEPAQKNLVLDEEKFPKSITRSISGKVDEETAKKITLVVQKELEKINNPVIGGFRFEINQASKDALQQTIHEFVEYIKDATPSSQEKLQEFVHRVYEILVRLSIHHAILDLRTCVEAKDVIYARKIYQPIWKSIIYNVEDLLVPSSSDRVKMHSTILKSIEVYKRLAEEQPKGHIAYDKAGGIWIRRATLIQYLQPLWDNCSSVTANKRFSKIETTNIQDTNKNKYFLMKSVKGVPYVKQIQEV